MRKSSPEEQPQTVREMAAEYDFRAGVRGKHHKSYRSGHTVRVQRADGTVAEQRFTLEDGAVMLEPDVRQYFPDSESVNTALRSIIKLIPKRRARAKAR